MIEVFNSVARPRVDEAVFFGFDDISIPLRSGVTHRLVSGKVGHYSAPIAVRNGPPGSHDEMVFYYGSVIQIGDMLHMWYLGRTGDPQSPYFEEQFPFSKTPKPAKSHPGLSPRWDTGIGLDGGKVCYATSSDGLHWKKPSLGLAEWIGSSGNNLVDFPLDYDILAFVVLHDPDDPDPVRRFKMVFEAQTYGLRVGVATSPDGLRWTESPENPVAPKYEVSGLTKFNDYYIVAGQDGLKSSDFPGRYWNSMISYDFQNWRHGGIHSLKRDAEKTYPHFSQSPIAKEQVHLGAALHHRGNVVLGIYGQWHHPESNDRRQVTCDLGLAISTEALHYHEPVPGFRFVGAEEEPETPFGLGPALSQGQGMAQIGDQTFYYYGAWPAGGHVRVARWPRDRFGFLQIIPDSPSGTCVTCPLHIHDNQAQVFLNVDGLNEHSEVLVEVLDEQCRELHGYCGESAAHVMENGFRVPVRWPQQSTLPVGQTCRLRLRWRGVRPEDAKLYAIYIA